LVVTLKAQTEPPNTVSVMALPASFTSLTLTKRRTYPRSAVSIISWTTSVTCSPRLSPVPELRRQAFEVMERRLRSGTSRSSVTVDNPLPTSTLAATVAQGRSWVQGLARVGQPGLRAHKLEQLRAGRTVRHRVLPCTICQLIAWSWIISCC